MAKVINENIDMADPVSQDGSGETSGGKIKTMAQKSSAVNPEITASPNTDNPVIPGNFHEFKGSQARMYTTYENRMDKIAQALGNKSPIKS